MAVALGGRLWALVTDAGGAQGGTSFLEQDWDGWRRDVTGVPDGSWCR